MTSQILAENQSCWFRSWAISSQERLWFLFVSSQPGTPGEISQKKNKEWYKWLYFFRYIWLGESYILFGGYSLLNIAMYGYIGREALKWIFQTQNPNYFSPKKTTWSTCVWDGLSGHLDLISRRRELGKRENYLDRSAGGARIYHVGRWKPLCNFDRGKFWLLNRHFNTSIHSY